MPPQVPGHPGHPPTRKPLTHMSRLSAYVHTSDTNGVPVTFGPGDEVPDWAARKITNPEAWENGELPEGLEKDTVLINDVVVHEAPADVTATPAADAAPAHASEDANADETPADEAPADEEKPAPARRTRTRATKAKTEE